MCVVFFFKKLRAIFKLQSDLSRQLRSRYSFLFWAGGIDFGGKIPAYWGQSNFWFSDSTLLVWLGYSSQHNHQKGCAHKIKWKFQRQTNSGLSDLMPFKASKMFSLLSRHKAHLRPVFPLVLGFLCHLLLNNIVRQIWLYKYYANFWGKSWQTEGSAVSKQYCG